MAGYKSRITGSGKGKNIGTEGMYERLPAWTGLRGGYGRIGIKSGKTGSGAKGSVNISGPTQKAGVHPSVVKQAKTINPVRFLIDRGWKITSFGAISAGSALSTKKKKQKKRVGRTILTEY